MKLPNKRRKIFCRKTFMFAIVLGLNHAYMLFLRSFKMNKSLFEIRWKAFSYIFAGASMQSKRNPFSRTCLTASINSSLAFLTSSSSAKIG